MTDPTPSVEVPAEPAHAVPVERGSLTPMEMLAAAVERGADLSLIDKLMDLQERWETRKARKAYEEAMALALAELEPIKRNRHVKFAAKSAGSSDTDYWHEDFSAVAKAVNPVLAKYGLGYRFRTMAKPGEPITVTCVVFHRDGHSEENTMTAQHDATGNKNSIQAMGSTVTYLQRYTLKAALGLAVDHDDDGKAAGADEPITEEQLDQIATLMIETESDEQRFCTYFGIEKVADLPRAKFQAAVDALTAKGKPKAKKREAAA